MVTCKLTHFWLLQHKLKICCGDCSWKYRYFILHVYMGL